MRRDFLDRYSRLDSLVHRVSAAVKVGVTVGTITLLVLMPLSKWWWFAVIAVFWATAAILSRVPLGFLLRRVMLLEPFVLGVAVLSLFQPGGLQVFAGIVVRSTLCLSFVVLLSNTTPFSDLLRLLRTCRAPDLFITTLALMYRYFFVLVDEAERMNRARAGRTFDRRRWPGWKTLATVISQLRELIKS